MKKNTLYCIFFGIFSLMSEAQQTIVRGSVLDGITKTPIPNVIVIIEATQQRTKTNTEGKFRFSQRLPLGEQVLKIEKLGYTTKRYPIIINAGQTLDIKDMTLDFDTKDIFIISISEDHLNSEDDGLTDNVSGLLRASRDVFLNAAAFDFSATFFRPRGLDNSNGKVLINGIEMNKQLNGRPQWANWGGLNDVQRNQEFYIGMSANDYTFGDLAGTTNIIMRASKYKQGGRISIASANRSYQGRIMASYNSGVLKSNWSYSILGSKRFGTNGYINGTLYDANSFSITLEKRINSKHSINFTGIYAHNKRGRSAAITQEVYKLKGRQYNPFWGTQNKEQRNSKIRDINEPIVMLNHFWDITPKVKLNTNIAYQFGEIINTRIDNGGTRLYQDANGHSAFLGGAGNPDPTYYQKLPSYPLGLDNVTASNYQDAFRLEQNFITDGQMPWSHFYETNQRPNHLEGTSTYALQANVVKDQQVMFNTIFDIDFSEHIRLNARVNYRHLKSQNFARIEDLLGGTGYLDIDFFADESTESLDTELTGNRAQSNIRTPNRIVKEGDDYKYKYDINTNAIAAFTQVQFKYNRVEFYLGAHASRTTYQRNGHYENGFFQGGGLEGSFGKSPILDFSNFGLKGGITYKVTGKHIMDINTSIFTKAPIVKNAFSNPRQSNAQVIGLENEKISAVDISYIFRAPFLNARITGFYSKFQNGTDIGFYFTENLAGLGIEQDAFVQEVVSNIKRQHIGIEIGVSAQITPTIKLKTAASIGQYTYTNNPNLYLTSVDFNGPLIFGNGRTELKNYHISGGPERAYQIGFEYRDPDFWNIGVTSNSFSNAYIKVSNLARSANFTSDFDGTISSAYNPEIARGLLQQEQFKAYTLINVIGGKSWRINTYYLGCFAVVNNVFNQTYKTGGFEQSRLASFSRVLEDQSRLNGAWFGPKYFFGNGTTYYVNVYLRF